MVSGRLARVARGSRGPGALWQCRKVGGGEEKTEGCACWTFPTVTCSGTNRCWPEPALHSSAPPCASLWHPRLLPCGALDAALLRAGQPAWLLQAQMQTTLSTYPRRRARGLAPAALWPPLRWWIGASRGLGKGRRTQATPTTPYSGAPPSYPAHRSSGHRAL